MRNSEQGRSMVEMIGILAVVMVLTVVAVGYFNKMIDKYRINTIREQITEVVLGVKQYFNRAGNYRGLDTESAIGVGIIPKNMTIEGDDSQARTIYGGDFRIETMIDPITNRPVFMVIIDKLPKQAALDLSTADWQLGGDLLQLDLVNNEEQAAIQEEVNGGTK